MYEQHVVEARRPRYFRSPATGAWRSVLMTFTLLTSIFSSTIGAPAACGVSLFDPSSTSVRQRQPIR